MRDFAKCCIYADSVCINYLVIVSERNERGGASDSGLRSKCVASAESAKQNPQIESIDCHAVQVRLAMTK